MSAHIEKLTGIFVVICIIKNISRRDLLGFYQVLSKIFDILCKISICAKMYLTTLTRAVRGSDHSPSIALSEEKDKLVTEN